MCTKLVPLLLVWGITLHASTSLASWTIEGQLVDETGRGIESARITLDQEVHETDSAGRFSLFVDDSPISLRLEADGYYAAVQTVAAGDLDSRPLSVTLVKRREGRSLLLFAGDAMLSRRFFEPRAGEPVLIRKGHELEDGKLVLEAIRPYVTLADFASVNLETQLSSEPLTQRLPKSITFYSPAQTAELMKWAGFDYVTLGNNHSWDYQDQGFGSTVASLNKAGMPWSGAGFNESEARKPYLTTLGGHRFGFLGYVGWAGTFSPSQAAEGDKGGAALGTVPVFADDLAKLPGTGVSVLQFHGGLEYAEAPAVSERTRLRRAVDLGADLAIGHHPHVIQGFERYGDRLIAYSMGNFLFDQYHYTTQLAMLLFVWMDGKQLHRAEVVPLYVNSYLPTPATGRMRFAVLNRLARLSLPFGTCLEDNGAHAVIEKCAAQQLAGTRLALPSGPGPSAPIHLAELGASSVKSARIDSGDKEYRLGTDLVPRGDFESAGQFGTVDRAWIESDQVAISDGAERKLSIQVAGKATSRTGMKVFERVFKPSNPTTLTGRIRSDRPVLLRSWLQRRRMDDELEEALESGPAKPVGEYSVSPGQWQTFSFDFDTPRISTRSIRFVFEIENDGAPEEFANVQVDDIAWVEWTTPWLPGDRDTQPRHATHVQTSKRD